MSLFRSVREFAHRPFSGMAALWPTAWCRSDTRLPRLSAFGCLLTLGSVAIFAISIASGQFLANAEQTLNADATRRIVEFERVMGRAISDLKRAEPYLVAGCSEGAREVLIQQSLGARMVNQMHWLPAGAQTICSPIETGQERLTKAFSLALTHTRQLDQELVLVRFESSVLIGLPTISGGYLIGELSNEQLYIAPDVVRDGGNRTILRRWDGPVLSDSVRLVNALGRPDSPGWIEVVSAWYLSNWIQVSVPSERFPVAVEIVSDPSSFLDTAVRYFLVAIVATFILTFMLMRGINTYLARRISMQRRLRVAIRKRQFEPAIQPIVDAQTGVCLGGEILMRWRHPARGLLAPAEFMGMAEQLGLVGDMTMMIMMRARDQLGQILKLHPQMYFSFNVEPSQLRDPSFQKQLDEIFRVDELPPCNIVIELVEREAVDARARVVLENLRSQGYRVAIDDFGTGQSSLALLSSIGFDILKIDRSFVSSIGTNDVNRSVLDAIIELASQLGVSTIAEGVETEAQHSELVAKGVKLIQGYLVSRPMPVTQFSQWLYAQKNPQINARKSQDNSLVGNHSMSVRHRSMVASAQPVLAAARKAQSEVKDEMPALVRTERKTERKTERDSEPLRGSVFQTTGVSVEAFPRHKPGSMPEPMAATAQVRLPGVVRRQAWPRTSVDKSISIVPI